MRRVWRTVLALAGLLGAAVAASAEDGVTAKEIVLGATTPLTGAVTVSCMPEVNGAQAYLKKVNAAGGVNGRTIRYELLDDAYSAPRAVGNIRRLLQQDRVFAIFGGCGTPTSGAVLSLMEKETVPYLFPYAGLDKLVDPPKPNIFTLLPRYSTQMAILLPEVIATDKPRTAFVLTFNIPGSDTVLKTVRETLDKGGVKVLGDVMIDVTSPERAAFALQAKNLDPDLVILNDTSSGSARFVLELQRQGWRPRVLAGVSNLADESFLRAVGSAADGWLRTVGITVPPTEAAARECVDAMAAFDAALQPTQLSMHGCLKAKVLTEALRRVEGEPSRAKLVAALDGLRDYETGFSGKVEFNARKRMGLESMPLLTIEGGRYKVGRTLPIPD